MTERRTVVITGASDGIGRAAAITMAEHGEHVVVVGHDPDRTRAVAERIDAPWHVVDYAQLSQVRRLADELLGKYPRIDVLVNNAGGAFPAGRRTSDGFDLNVQIDFLSPFLLTNLLIGRLEASHASVIITSSMAADWGRISTRSLESQQFGSAARAYGTAKLMDLIFAIELQRSYGAKGLHAVAFHPGVIATSFGTHGSPFFQWLYGLPLAERVMGTPASGSRELVRLALGEPGRDWEPGGFTQFGRRRRIPSQARDPRRRQLVWDWAVHSTGL